MMWIFYIDWQQNWKYEWTMNIGANAHGKRTVSTKQPQVTDLTVGLRVTSERYWAGVQVTKLFHSATVSQCGRFFVTLPGWLLELSGFCVYGGGVGGCGGGGVYIVCVCGRGGGGLSSNIFTIWCCILILMPSALFRRFKRHSCY